MRKIIVGVYGNAANVRRSRASSVDFVKNPKIVLISNLYSSVCSSLEWALGPDEDE